MNCNKIKKNSSWLSLWYQGMISYPFENNGKYDDFGIYFTSIFPLLGRSACGRLVENRTKLNIMFSFLLELCWWKVYISNSIYLVKRKIRNLAWSDFEPNVHRNFVLVEKNTNEIVTYLSYSQRCFIDVYPIIYWITFPLYWKLSNNSSISIEGSNFMFIQISA